MKATDARMVWLYRVIIGTVFLTGFSGLVYEVTWQKYLSNLLGSQAQATAIVLAVYLGGLSVGYFLFGRSTRNRSPRAVVKNCGLAEMGIGLWALLFPTLYSLFWEHFGVINPTSNISIVYDFLTAVVLIGPPTVLMGCTLPLLTQGMSALNLSQGKNSKNSALEASSIHTRIYTINTLGAFVGCILAGFYLLPQFGLPLTDLNMAVINLSCGIVIASLSRMLSNTPIQMKKQDLNPKSAEGGIDFKSAASVSFLAGFIGLSFQTGLIRVVGLSVGSSEYAFSMIVSIYIFMLAFGASFDWRNSSYAKYRLMINQSIILLGMIGFYFLVPHLPYIVMLARTSLTTTGPNFYIYHAICMILFGAVLFLPVGAMGRVMPLVFRYTFADVSRSGLYVGRLYFWNSLGCLCGALIGGYILFYEFNLDTILRICIGIAGASWLILFSNVQLERKKLYQFGASFACLVILFVALVPGWNNKYLAYGLFRVQAPFPTMFEGRDAAYEHTLRGMEVIARRDDPNTSVSVLEVNLPSVNKVPYTRSIVVNGKSDGSTGSMDVITMRVVAHLAAMLTETTNKNAAVIGFGTGMSIGSLLLYPDIQKVDALEISSGVKDFAHYFDFVNHNASKNPKMHWKISDAYRFLASSPEKYGLIISEPSNPWVSGVEKLFTSEFYKRTLESLDDKGVFAQWFHLYSASPKTVAMVIRTFSEVFPNIRTFVLDAPGDLVLLGSKNQLGPRSLALLRERFEIPGVKEEFQQLGIVRAEQLLSFEWDTPVEAFADSSVNTLDFPKLSFAAGKDFFLGNMLDLKKLQSTSELMPWAALARDRTLKSLWVRSLGKTPENQVRTIVSQECQLDPHPDPKLPSKIQYRDCGAIRSIAAVYGLREYEKDLNPIQLKALRELAGTQKPDPVERGLASQDLSDEKFQQLEAKIQLFSMFRSIYLPLKKDLLKEQLKPCFMAIGNNAVKCRMKFVEALAWQGFSSDARKELEALKEVASSFKGPKKTWFYLEGSVAHSERASSILSAQN